MNVDDRDLGGVLLLDLFSELNDFAIFRFWDTAFRCSSLRGWGGGRMNQNPLKKVSKRGPKRSQNGPQNNTLFWSTFGGVPGV